MALSAANSDTVSKPPLAPLKSVLRTQTSKADSKPDITRTVTFVPGWIRGKSDILQIESYDVAERSEEESDNDNSNSHNSNSNHHNSNEPLFDDNEFSFTNWKFGSTFSGSETSDDEKSFDVINKKYQTWSPQFMKNKERQQKMDSKLKSSLQKLKQKKQNISELRVQIMENSNDNSDSEKPLKRKRIRRKNRDIDNEYKQWKKKQNKKGVIYIASVPFGCTNIQLKKIFSEFGVITNVHLEAAKGENGQKKRIHNKWTEFCEGWVEFKDKRIAKEVVQMLNETKIPKKYVKNRLAKTHIWSLKYLKGFGWHHLEEYKQTVRTLQRKKYEIKIADAHRQTAYFESQVTKAKEMINGIVSVAGEEDRESESSEDNGPPMKKQKVVQQRTQRKRRNHRNNKVLDELVK